MINCYVINLNRATDRWESVVQSPGLRNLNIIRVPAVDGKTLRPLYPNFSSWGFFFCTGHRPRPNPIACYNSHLKALNMFLDSGEEFGIICEDDITGTLELHDILKEVLRYSKEWDWVRLTGFRQKSFIPFADLGKGYQLVSDLRCASSSGCYLLNRKAAQLFLYYFGTMRVYYDLAVFYSAPVGIREAAVVPFPVKLNGHSHLSQIGHDGTTVRYPFWHPYRLNVLTVWAYRAFTRTRRRLHRVCLGLKRWFFPPEPLI